MIGPEELAELEAALLPALERHQLRLLAHGLRTLQAAAGRRSGDLPSEAELASWASAQDTLAADPDFRSAFLAQIGALGERLRQIARERGEAPLDLDLQDLIQWSRSQADQRCGAVNPPEMDPGPPG